nr:hypothetical protein [Sphingobium yanoikuyae]
MIEQLRSEAVCLGAFIKKDTIFANAWRTEVEAPRVSRRLQLVRRSIRYEQDNQQIFT